MLNHVPDRNISGSGASGSARVGNNNNNNNRGRSGRRNNHAAPPVSVFEGSEPLLKGFIYDVPNGATMNQDQFNKTTKQTAIVMATDMGMYAPVLSTAFNDLILIDPVVIQNPADVNDALALHIWKRDLKEYDGTLKAYRAFKAKLFLKVVGQCSEAMKSSMIRHQLYETVNNLKDGFGLLTIVEEITIGMEGRSNTAIAVAKVKDQYMKIRHGNKSLSEYLDTFKGKVATLDRIGGNLIEAAVANEIAVANGRVDPNADDNREAKDKSVAATFILHSSYPKYITELHNAMLNGDDHYPTSLDAAYEIMHLWPRDDSYQPSGWCGLYQCWRRSTRSRTQWS
jgi:hypothetical protein